MFPQSVIKSVYFCIFCAAFSPFGLSSLLQSLSLLTLLLTRGGLQKVMHHLYGVTYLRTRIHSPTAQGGFKLLQTQYYTMYLSQRLALQTMTVYHKYVDKRRRYFLQFLNYWLIFCIFCRTFCCRIIQDWDLKDYNVKGWYSGNSQGAISSAKLIQFYFKYE